MSATWKTYKVLGTSCASCEVVLERELRKVKGVERVQASHNAGQVRLLVNDATPVHLADLQQALAGHKYRFQEVWENAPKFSWKNVLYAAGLVAVMYILLSKLGILRVSTDVDASAGYVAVFVVGIVAAFSSCTAIVGGLLAAVSARQAQASTRMSFRDKMRPHILFNAGRLIGFVGFGALIGLLGSAVQLSEAANGALVVAVAVLMMLLGLQLMGVLPPALARIRPPKRIAHWVHSLSESDKPWVPAILGAATFFLPCGFTQSMQLYALSLGNPAQSALVMGIFALGTLPALLGIGYVTSTARGNGLRQLTYAIGALVIAIGIANVQNGATLLGVTGLAPTGEAVSAEVDGEVQKISMRVTSAGVYEPQVLRVQSGIPVQWEILRDEWVGCGSSLVMPAFNVQKNLKSGKNVVEFTPTKTGTFTFSCSMGMIRGTMIVE